LFQQASRRHDVRLLTETCAGEDMKTIEDARPVFFCSWPKNARALCFLWRCGDEDEMEDFAPLRLSAELVFCAVSFLLFVEAGE
jgi:hypothetical protein